MWQAIFSYLANLHAKNAMNPGQEEGLAIGGTT